MGLFEISELLEPLTGDKPTGEDLEYDNSFIELELNAQGTPDRVELVKDPDDYDGKRVLERLVPGKEANPQDVLDAALALFKRAKDLRIAMYVAYGSTRIEGLAGLANGTELILKLLEQYWDQVHPRLDPDDPDPFMRINILNGFADPAKLLRAIKNAPFAESRAIGRFTLRDLEVANGEVAPLEGQVAATPELLRAACMEMEPAVLDERIAASKAALENLAAMVSIFRERTSSYPDFGIPKKSLELAVTVYNDAIKLRGGGEGEAVNSDEMSGGVEEVSGGSVGGKVSSGKIASRADAKRILEQVTDYLEKAEPAHPSPLLIRRAIRLLDMNFLDIMRELTPDAVQEIQRLGGIRDE